MTTTDTGPVAVSTDSDILYVNPPLSARDRMTALIEQKRQAEKELQAMMRAEGAPLLAELLDEHAHPSIMGLAWYQYTPYFNDGDECVFSVNDPSVMILDDDGETLLKENHLEDPDEDGDERSGLPGVEVYGLYYDMGEDYIKKYWKGPFYERLLADAELRESLKKVLEVFGEIPQELFREAFGDHVKVILNFHTGKAEVDEYTEHYR